MSYQTGALPYTRYLELNNRKREEHAILPLTLRKNANTNLHAYFYGKALTEDVYRNARMIAYPPCLFDCDIPVQGAAAMVVTTAELARSLKPKPAFLAGYGQRMTPGESSGLGDWMTAGRSTSSLAYERSGLGPEDIDVAQLYDGYVYSILFALESYGFAKPGQALDFVQGGNISPAGGLPLNTFGGSPSAGRMHGLTLVEAVLQASGRSSNQVKDANVAFASTGSPHLAGVNLIFAGGR